MKLEDKILEIVNEATGAKYTGKVIIDKDGDYWMLRLSPTKEISLLTLGYEGDENGFISFVEREVIKRRLNRGSAKATIQNGDSFQYKPIIEL